MLIVLKQVSLLFIFIFIGWAFGKWKKVQADRAGLLSFLLVNLFLPSKVFSSFSKNFTVDYIKEKYILLLAAIGLLAVMVLLSKLISKPLAKTAYENKVFQYSLVVSNYAYMGYALSEDMFGGEGLTDFIMFCIPFTLYIYTYGYAMLTGGGRSLKKVVNPMTVSILIGMIFGLTGLKLPELLGTALSSAAACMSPISMLLTGLTLSTFPLKKLISDRNSYIIVAIRLLALPVITAAVCALLNIPEYIRSMAVLYAALPCGLNTVVFPKLVGEDCTPGARLAFISNPLACLTVPLCMTLLL